MHIHVSVSAGAWRASSKGPHLLCLPSTGDGRIHMGVHAGVTYSENAESRSPGRRGRSMLSGLGQEVGLAGEAGFGWVLTGPHTCHKTPFKVHQQLGKLQYPTGSHSHTPKSCFRKLGKLSRNLVFTAAWYNARHLADTQCPLLPNKRMNFTSNYLLSGSSLAWGVRTPGQHLWLCSSIPALWPRALHLCLWPGHSQLSLVASEAPSNLATSVEIKNASILTQQVHL